jgi:hypothetical protein
MEHLHRHLHVQLQLTLAPMDFVIMSTVIL